MFLSLRRFALSALLCCLLTPVAGAFAQDPVTRVTGSAIIEPLLQALIAAAAAEDTLYTDTTGSRTGLNHLCAGDSFLSSSTQAIGEDQLNTCTANGISLAKFTLGHDVLAVIAHPGVADFVNCLDDEQLTAIFAPSAGGNVTTWQQVQTDAPESLALTVHAPPEMTSAYSLLDGLVSGDGLRDDAIVPASAVESVVATRGAIGVAALGATGDAHVLALNSAASEGCRAPSAETVEDGLYPAASQLLLYVNVAQVNAPGVAELLEVIAGEDAAGVVESAGFVAPSPTVMRENAGRLQAAQQGEAAPLTAGGFAIPENVAGALRIGGSGHTYAFANAALEGIRASSPGLNASIAHLGHAAGMGDLCGGALDVVLSDRAPTVSELAACDESNIESLSLPLGASALVLLANESDVAPACLTTAQVGEIWRAESAGVLMRWKDLDAGLPDEAMTLLAPRAGSPEGDMLLAVASAGLIGRGDIELDDDPLYRAAATANVPGALTYLSWPEYERVLDNGQERIRLVELDAGAGCVSASQESILDGDWPLSRNVWLTVNRSRLTLPQVQSWLWFMSSEDNLLAWQNAALVGIRPVNLQTLQATLENAFDEAGMAALARMNEAEESGEGDAESEGDGG